MPSTRILQSMERRAMQRTVHVGIGRREGLLVEHPSSLARKASGSGAGVEARGLARERRVATLRDQALEPAAARARLGPQLGAAEAALLHCLAARGKT
jgi:hypothetical protein